MRFYGEMKALSCKEYLELVRALGGQEENTGWKV